MNLNFWNILFYLKKIDALSVRENSYIFNNKDTSLPFILSPFHTRARVIIRDCKKKKSTQGPALKLEPTPLQATASLRPLLVSFRLVFLIDPPSQKLFIACNQHIFVNRQEITFIAISYD